LRHAPMRLIRASTLLSARVAAMDCSE
jgi:hypothetical protein